MNTDYRIKISDFLFDYVNPTGSRSLNFGGGMTDSTMKEAVLLLLASNVFTSPEDMKRQALKKYNVILPQWLF